VRLGQDVTAQEHPRSDAGNSQSLGPPESVGHNGVPSWTGNISPATEQDISPATSSLAGAGYWAIKIMDRQPRKKLPGIKKLSGGNSGLDGDARQSTITNEKLATGSQQGRTLSLNCLSVHRLKKEIAILKKCRHPNVVRLREVIDAPASKKIYLGKPIRFDR
jgi:hypothetical protein